MHFALFSNGFGLKIKMNETELVRIGDRRDGRSLARVLGCKVTNLPMKYLGLLLGAKFKDVNT